MWYYYLYISAVRDNCAERFLADISVTVRALRCQFGAEVVEIHVSVVFAFLSDKLTPALLAFEFLRSVSAGLGCALFDYLHCLPPFWV